MSGAVPTFRLFDDAYILANRDGRQAIHQGG